MSDLEKRRTQRKQSEYVIEFYDSGGSLLVGVGRVLDLSPTGALVESTLRLEPGQVLMARLRRGDHSRLDLLATVIRVRSKGAMITYGIKFNHP